MEQWIFAGYHTGNNGEPGDFEYYISPPDGWSEVDKLRVLKHFKDFDLAKRYATKAAEQFGTVLNQVAVMERAGLDKGVIRNVLLQPAVDAAPFVNHWQKGMYQAIIDAML